MQWTTFVLLNNLLFCKTSTAWVCKICGIYLHLLFVYLLIFFFESIYFELYFPWRFWGGDFFTFIDTTPIRYWRGSIKKDHSVHFQLIKVCPKLCGNSNFPKNFHMRKLGEITVFYAVMWTLYIDIVFIKLKRLLNVFI